MKGEEKQSIEEVLENEGVYISTTVGMSMYPMLRNRRDTIIIRPCNRKLKKYEIALYKRGEKYILHRVVKVLPDSYVICGDNCRWKEYGIQEDQITGVLWEFYRDGKKVKLNGIIYQIYARIWVAMFPFRNIVWNMKKRLGKFYSQR